MKLWPFRYPHVSRYGHNVTTRWPGSRNTWPVLAELSWAHWNGLLGGGCCHGPCSMSWPWWKLVSAKYCVLGHDPSSPCSGRRLWIYTRWGALYVDSFVDRRVFPATRDAARPIAPMCIFFVGLVSGFALALAVLQ